MTPKWIREASGRWLTVIVLARVVVDGEEWAVVKRDDPYGNQNPRLIKAAGLRDSCGARS